jgi:hypothetical protein
MKKFGRLISLQKEFIIYLLPLIIACYLYFFFLLLLLLLLLQPISISDLYFILSAIGLGLLPEFHHIKDFLVFLIMKFYQFFIQRNAMNL